MRQWQFPVCHARISIRKDNKKTPNRQPPVELPSTHNHKACPEYVDSRHALIYIIKIQTPSESVFLPFIRFIVNTV